MKNKNGKPKERSGLPNFICHSTFSEDEKERVMGIEPTYPAWKAGVLPLNYTRKQCPEPESNQ